MPLPGTIYWDRLGKTEPTEHLRVVLNQPDAGSYVVVASLTDSKKKPSYPVLLQRGHHSAITKDTTVMFPLCGLFQVTFVRERWQICQAHLNQLHPTHLQRICQAVMEHNDVEHRVRVALGWIAPFRASRINRFPRKLEDLGANDAPKPGSNGAEKTA